MGRGLPNPLPLAAPAAQCQQDRAVEPQQAQQEEDEHLGHIGDHIKEVDQIALLGQLGIAHPDAAEVGAEIPVSAQGGGQGIGQDDHRKDEDGLALSRWEGPPLQGPDGQLAQQQTAQDPPRQLLEQKQRDHDLLPGHKPHCHRGQHIGDGVVGARFDLQQRVSMLLQRQLFRPQDIEH